jgi:hypothetical protein
MHGTCTLGQSQHRQNLPILAYDVQSRLVMTLSNPILRKPTKKLIATALIFLGEQDGPSERMLKGQLYDLFAESKNLQKAYLARTQFREAGNESVCLCLSVSSGADEPLVEEIHHLFAQLFNRAVHLDILFLSSRQEEQVAAVCKPFYRRALIQ